MLIGVIALIGGIIGYLIGCYKTVSKKRYNNLSVARDYWQDNYCQLRQKYFGLEADLRHANHVIKNSPKVMIVPNIDPHHAADIKYVGIYPALDSGLEPAHLTREAYQKGVERLRDHPEDKAI